MRAILHRLAQRVRRLGVTAEAWYQLARAAIVIRSAARHARVLRDGLCLRPGRSDRGSGLEVARAVARASRFHVKPMACLERSLATLWMLRGRGIAAALRIGCRQQGTALEFHAWVVDDSGAVLAGQGHESSFLPLTPEASAAGPPRP
jgi:hypothetical protein